MSPHQPEGQTEHLGAKLQKLAKKRPADQTNSDPETNSGYPAGGERTRPGRDAYEKPTTSSDDSATTASAIVTAHRENIPYGSR